MQKWMKKFAALLAGLSLAGTTLPSVAAQTGDDNKVDLILDWVPSKILWLSVLRVVCQ